MLKCVIAFGPVVILWMVVWGLAAFVVGDITLFVIACAAPVCLFATVALIFGVVFWICYWLGTDDSRDW